MNTSPLTTLFTLANPEKAQILQRFFKTGKGEYDEGDKFLWITVPEIRKVAKQYVYPKQSHEKRLSLDEIETLLHSERHEARMCALLMLVEQVRPHLWKACLPQYCGTGGSRGDSLNEKRISWVSVMKEIVDLYLRNTAFINNRDLVDLSAPELLGPYYFENDRSILYTLAKSDLLRDRRIAILTTFYFIKHGQYEDTFKLAELLLHDKENLLQKAVWRMLREVGKRIDQQLLVSFLDQYHQQMPRTMVRYAIERLPQALKLEKKY